ncbi:MAG: class I SAM-dependent rRNA methyltransferase [Clostridiales bacterium]|nr:class I SAM-dependent rRNA methyltransferase [Clostridiales bacterium]
MTKITLRKTRETRVRSGHPWLYASEIERVEGESAAGVAEVYSAKGTFLARALYNPASQIALRILTTHDEPIDADFFARRVRTAWEYRQRFCDVNSCRAIYAEADFLPGLVVDKFGGVLVVQVLSLGMELWKRELTDILVEVIRPEGIYERNDVPVRRLEGMQETTGLLYGDVPDRVPMVENGIVYAVDVKHGQKTGFFLDQKENRAAIAPLCPGARVIDMFCHNGSFALNAAKYGAREVTGVDISEEALAVARDNARANGLDANFEAHNCFDLLRALSDQGEKYDLVILDPPAFTKTRQMTERALRGYKEINLRGMKLVPDGGFLVSCSCSQHVDDAAFTAMLNEAARDAKKKLRMVEFRTQAKDHPILPASPETKYLKCAILQVFS